jgi:hypothetical protein
MVKLKCVKIGNSLYFAIPKPLVTAGVLSVVASTEYDITINQE